MSRINEAARRVFLGSAAAVVACMPLVLLAERFGWNQRPLHLAQSFVAVPAACVSSALYLWGRRGLPGEVPVRLLAWLVFVGTSLWLMLIAYVLWFADFSWMNQK